MRSSICNAMVSVIAVMSLLVGPLAHAVVTVPVVNSTGSPVANQTITLQFPSGRTREAVTNSMGEVTLEEDEEDEDGMLLISLGDGSQISYELTGAGAGAAGVPAWQWVVGGLVAAGGIAAATNDDSSSSSPQVDEPVSDGDTGGDTGGDAGGGACSVLTASCTVSISQILNGAAPDDPDLVGQVNADATLECRDVSIDYSGLIVGTVMLTCDVEDDLGLSFCNQVGGSITLDGVSATQSGGGFSLNEAGDAVNSFSGFVDFDFDGGTASANFEGPCSSP